MNASLKWRLTVAILSFTILYFVVVEVPIAQALSFNYADSTWQSLTVKGPDVTKQGNVEAFTVSGMLLGNMTGSVRLKLWLFSSSQVRVLFDDFVLAPGFYLAGSSFIEAYLVTIRSDADNNKYIYASLTAGSSLYNFTLSLVQNPTYAELQTQVALMQANISSLTSQLNSLQNSYSKLETQLASLQLNYNNLQNNYTNLINNSTSEKSLLLAQINALTINNSQLMNQIDALENLTSQLQSRITILEDERETLHNQVQDLQANNTLLQSNLIDAQTNNTALAYQKGNLQSENVNLQNQVNNLTDQRNQLILQSEDLQAKLEALTLNSTNLHSQVNSLNKHILSLQQDLKDSQSENTILHSNNINTSFMLYLAILVAVIFIALAGYALLVLFKGKRKGKNDDAPLF
jgi:predicted nuclease with TOPRIM domain